MLMQLASITFDGEKKKPKNYIIPATFFISTTVKKEVKKEFSPSKPDHETSIAQPITEVSNNTVLPVKDIPKPKLNIDSNRKSSGLSLSSITT